METGALQHTRYSVHSDLEVNRLLLQACLSVRRSYIQIIPRSSFQFISASLCNLYTTVRKLLCFTLVLAPQTFGQHDIKPFFYLLHLSLGYRLSLKPGVGPAQAGVSSGRLRVLSRSVREAVEESHLLSQTEGGQVRLVRDRPVAISLGPGAWSLSWFLVLLGLLLLILSCRAWLGGGGLDAG